MIAKPTWRLERRVRSLGEMQFGWDEGKRRWLLDDRAIDLEDMKPLFDGRARMTYSSPRGGEDRSVSVGRIEDRLFAVVWMWRDGKIWLITARRAWKSEERQFASLVDSEGGS